MFWAFLLHSSEQQVEKGEIGYLLSYYFYVKWRSIWMLFKLQLSCKITHLKFSLCKADPFCGENLRKIPCKSHLNLTELVFSEEQEGGKGVVSFSAHLLQVGRQQKSRGKKLLLFVHHFSLTRAVVVNACKTVFIPVWLKHIRLRFWVQTVSVKRIWTEKLVKETLKGNIRLVYC